MSPTLITSRSRCRCRMLPILLGIICSTVAIATNDVHNQSWTTRIVGGNLAGPGFSYQVSLRFNGSHVGGGVIIGPTEILTAAHCAQYDDPDQIEGFSIKAGSTLRTGHDRKTQYRNVARIISHYKFKEGETGTVYDIAVLKLASPLKFNSAVQAIGLPKVSKKGASPASGEGEGAWVVASGWGTTREGEGPRGWTEELMKVALRIVSLDTCRKVYYESKINERMLCAAAPRGGHDACFGDSGGPLATADRKTLLGIISFGRGCGRPGVPGVYTRVSVYRKWIKAVAGV